MKNITFKNVFRVFDKGVIAVNDFNLEVGHDEFIVIVGPSGCGKSTTLRMLAGLERISDGEIIIDGQKINNLSPRDRNVAMVFQNYALYPHMTVRQNIGLNLKVKKFSKAEIETRINDAAGLLGLEDLLDRRPSQLSGGQSQRVALGRALVREPRAFLFDEPLSNLDAKLRVQMRKEIASLHQRLKTTMFYVTHDQVEAMTLGTRIIVMEQGVIQQVGTPLELFYQPDNCFVAGFIGSPAMNFASGSIVDGEQGQVFISDGGRLRCKIAPENKRYYQKWVGKPLLLGIRPEHFSLSASSDLIFRATPDHTETLGSECVLYFTENNSQITIRLPGMNVARDNGLTLGASWDDIHFFDPDTNKNISLECKPSLKSLMDKRTDFNLSEVG